MAVLQHLGLLASALALLSAAKDEAPVWGNIAIARVEVNATVPLVVENGAAVPVRVMGCNSTTVPPNGTARFLLAGLAQLWLIPDGRAADCHAGPFDNLFYVAADLLSSSPVVSIAHTTAKPDGAHSQNATSNDSGIGRVELIAGTPTNHSGNATAVCCTVAACGPNVEIAALPSEFTIVVLGPGPSSLHTSGADDGRGHDGQEGELNPEDEEEGYGHGHGGLEDGGRSHREHRHSGGHGRWGVRQQWPWVWLR